MNQRERILAAAVVAIPVAWAGAHYYSKFNETVTARRTAVQDAEQRLFNANLDLKQGQNAAKLMEGWQKRSLPANREKALSLYKAWLLAKAKDAGLSVSDITLSPSSNYSTSFSTLAYQIEATGTLSNVIAMLYEFYRSPQLQQVTKLRLTRPPGATQLQVSLGVEALSLPGADATDKLPEGETKRLKLANVAEYQKSLGERDLATVYSPPRPPSPPAEKRETPTPPKFDDAEFAMFSGAVGSGNDIQAWIHVQTTGEMLHLRAGDPIKVGAFEGQIVSVESRSLVLKSGDKTFRVAIGKSLRKGEEIAGDSAAKDAPAARPAS